jgi:hypothetical protein
MFIPDPYTPVNFHEDVFYAYFRPFRHPRSHYDIWGGHGLETFGEDLEIVRRADVNCIWTVLDCGEGPDQWIVPGFQFVNRICYLLTEVPHNDALIQFRSEGRPRPITDRGLARRLTTLDRIMKNHQLPSS